MAKPKILVSRRWPAAVEAKLADRFNVVLNKTDVALTPSEFRQAFADFDAVLPTVTDKIGADAMELSKTAHQATRQLRRWLHAHRHAKCECARHGRHQHPGRSI